jgi:TRAP-type mannitol/chloroaromatic compound transport system substrate-binding protein
MDRREFLRTTTAAAAAASTAATASSPASASEEIAAPAALRGLQELRLAMPWPDTAFGLADQAHRVAQRIAAMSDGRIRINFNACIADGLTAVRRGDADLYFASEHAHVESHRALAYFAGLPGERAIAPHHLAAWMQVGGGQTLWDDLAGDFGIKALLAGHSGDAPCLLATRRPSAMNELAGTPIAVEGLARDVARGLGMTPRTVDAGSLPQALAGGDIQAVELGGAIASHSLGIMKVAPHSAGTSISKHGSALALGMSRRFWDGLSPADQAIFTAAATSEYHLALAEESAHRRLLLPDPPASWPIAQELSRTIGRVADAVVAQVAAADTVSQRINASFVSFRSVVSVPAESTGRV